MVYGNAQPEVLFYVCMFVRASQTHDTDPKAKSREAHGVKHAGLQPQTTRDRDAVQVQVCGFLGMGVLLPDRGTSHAIAGVSLNMINTQAY